jgi:hypothetical protein
MEALFYLLFLLIGIALGWLIDKKRSVSVISDAQQKASAIVDRILSRDASKLEEINFTENENS